MKVNIISKVKHSVLVKVPYAQFMREWPYEGASIPVEKEILEQLMVHPGFKYMIDNGILYIEDMETKKELGIEPQEATEPVNVIVLNDKDRRKYLTAMPVDEFKEKITHIRREQLDQLIDYAIANRLVDYEKVRILKDLTGRDIIKAVELSDKAKEE